MSDILYLQCIGVYLATSHEEKRHFSWETLESSTDSYDFPNSSILSSAPKAYGVSRITALFGIYFIFPRNVYKWHPHKK